MNVSPLTPTAAAALSIASATCRNSSRTNPYDFERQLGTMAPCHIIIIRVFTFRPPRNREQRAM